MTPTKIIFLDFDGVVRIADSNGLNPTFRKDALDRLLGVAESADAKIVVTSDLACPVVTEDAWSLPKTLHEIESQCGAMMSTRFGRLLHTPWRLMNHHLYRSHDRRARMITEFLLAHQIGNFVIYDDRGSLFDGYPLLIKRLIETNSRYGVMLASSMKGHTLFDSPPVEEVPDPPHETGFAKTDPLVMPMPRDPLTGVPVPPLPPGGVPAVFMEPDPRKDEESGVTYWYWREGGWDGESHGRCATREEAISIIEKVLSGNPPEAGGAEEDPWETFGEIPIGSPPRPVSSISEAQRMLAPKSAAEMTFAFGDELDKLVNRFCDEWDIPVSIIIGCLQFKMTAIAMHHIRDCDEKDS